MLTGGYERLHSGVEKRAIQEMKHAEKLSTRILFLDGRPVVSVLNKIIIGAQVEAQLNLVKQMGIQNYLVEQLSFRNSPIRIAVGYETSSSVCA